MRNVFSVTTQVALILSIIVLTLLGFASLQLLVLVGLLFLVMYVSIKLQKKNEELEAKRVHLEQAYQQLQLEAEERKRSEEKFAKVFRSSPMGIAVTRMSDGKYIDVNEV